MLFLNPDCRISSEVVSRCVLRMAAEDGVAALSPNIGNANQSALAGGYYLGLRRAAAFSFFASRLFPQWSWTRGIFAYAPAGRSELPLDWLGGTALFVNRAAFNEVGGFSERWFMYGEDVDLGMRFHSKGYKQLMLLDVDAPHRGGGSQPAGSRPRIEWIANLLDVHACHAPTQVHARVFALLLAFGYATRAVLQVRGSTQRTQFTSAAKCCAAASVRRVGSPKRIERKRNVR